MKLPRHNAAFSLVEVLCAIFILGVGLVGLTHGIATALSSSKEAELQTTAALIAAGQIETLRADGFVIEGTTEGSCGQGLSLYRWKQTATKTSLDGLYEIAVVIENSNTGREIYTLRTLMFDPVDFSLMNDPDTRKQAAKPTDRERERRRR
jgi:prepilin-type N-terminal cleavage/methylation domain-containing protein